MKVELTNTAPNPLTNATIYWSFNGNTVQSITWSGYLARGQKATISLGQVTYISGNNTFVAWIQNLSPLSDEYPVDDTIKLLAYACDSTIHGSYMIGTTGHYTTISQALEKIKTCGASGDIILRLQQGIYTENVDLTDISIPLRGYNLTLTSVSGKAEDVVLQTTSSSIILNNSNNITIRNLTVDAISSMYGILFAGPTDNIVIRNCRIFSDSTTTSTIPTPIYKAGNSGTADNTHIIKNSIYGGYQGIYFYGGSDTNTYSTQVVIDSNTIQSSYLYGVYAYYTDFKSIFRNTVIQNRNVTYFRGFYFSYINGNITSNRIYNVGNYAHPRGIDVSYYNAYNSSVQGIIANNEIRLGTISYPAAYDFSNIGYGIRTSYSSPVIINNSINNTGPGVAGGIEVINPDSNKTVTIRNNPKMSIRKYLPMSIIRIVGIEHLYDHIIWQSSFCDSCLKPS
jgi:hypothetical protein